LILVLILFTPFYVALLLWCMFGLTNIEDEPAVNINKPQFLSVLIPFRNEAENLNSLFDDLSRQQLPKNLFEVIWVNDHSEDESNGVLKALIANEPSHKLIELNDPATGKKAALKMAIENAMGDVIITTDADCRVPATWLQAVFDGFNTATTDMLVLPLVIKSEEGILAGFQQLENLAIQGVAFGMAANGTPISCNGANLSFKSSTFHAVGGYAGHQNIASGDDLFLLSAFVKSKKAVQILWNKNVLVETSSEKNLTQVINQRLRWAGKMSKLNLPASTIAGGILFLHAVFMVIAVGMLFFNRAIWLPLLLVLVARVAADVMLIKTVANRYGQSLNPLKLTFVSMIYWLYLPFMVVMSMIKRSTWKGRTI
jgi:poly-beta-1,6-N-acetyl-D-glucosamine synthase